MVELEKLKQELKNLNVEAAKIREVAVDKRAELGRKLNARKQEILARMAEAEKAALDVAVEPLDVTAFSGVNEAMPELYPTLQGSRHPLMTELDRVVEIYQLMGFDVEESRQLDDEFHMILFGRKRD